ncbi:MAG TPA: CHAP domain-containing protein [Candidatus Dormibacteraeota bacterium]
MNRSVGLTLRRTAGGGVIFALSFGALASPGQSVMAVVASSAPAVALAPTADPDRHPLPVVHSSVSLFQEAAATASPASRTLQPAAHPAMVLAATQATLTPTRTAGNSSAVFAYGYCTWWVAHKRYIPWRGNAAQWWWNARAYGYAEGATPKVGAVMVMAAGGAASPDGHVAYVESVNSDGSFVVSEMNWWGVPGGGWGRVDYRRVTSMRGILGFIY